MRLWVRIAALMGVLSVVPLVLAVAVSTRIATRQAADVSAGILERDARTLATLVDTWTSDQVQALSGFMQLFPLEGQTADQHEALLKSVFLAVPTVVTVTLVDADGVPTVPPLYLEETPAATSPLNGREVGSADRASWLIERLPLSEVLSRRGTMATGAVGSPYVPPAADAPSLPVAVTGPFGEDLVVGAELSLADVERVFVAQNSADHEAVLLNAEGGSIFGVTPRLVDGKRLAPLLSAPLRFSYELADGREVRGAVVPIEAGGWAVAVAEPVDVAERAAIEIRRRAFLLLWFVIPIALASGVVVARGVSQPVGRLRDVALAVSEGRYGETADVERGDELGDLARAFDHMSRRLLRNQEEIQAQQAEIEAFNRELQARVEARTRDLEEAQRQLVRSGQLAAVAEVGAGLAHELNNPLAGILGLAQLLRARGDGHDDDLARIEALAERCRTVVASMLRLSTGEIDVEEAVSVDVREVLRDVVDVVGGPFRQRGVQLLLREPDGPLMVRVHPVLGGRILAQILGSMRAGLDEGACVEVSAQQGSSGIDVVLSPDRVVAVGAQRDEWMASGMGLWVARHLLDQVGGRLVEPDGDRLAWTVVLPPA